MGRSISRANATVSNCLTDLPGVEELEEADDALRVVLCEEEGHRTGAAVGGAQEHRPQDGAGAQHALKSRGP